MMVKMETIRMDVLMHVLSLHHVEMEQYRHQMKHEYEV